MRLRSLLICSALCSVGLWAQAPRDPHENPASPVNADDNSQLPPSSKPGSSAVKQTSKTKKASSNKNPGINAQDRAFIATAAKAGRDEVQRAQMMVNQSSNPEVKAFAQKLVADHEPANQALEAWARQTGMELPAVSPAPAGAHPMTDKAYMTGEVASHRKAIQLFEKEASAGLDRDLRGFAASMLPGLQQHLKVARSIQSGGSPLSTNSGNESATSIDASHPAPTPVTSSTPATTATTTTSDYTPNVAHPADKGDSKSGDRPAR